MFKKLLPGLMMALLATLTLLISACGGSSTPSTSSTSTSSSGGPSCVSGTIQASGSTALQPLATDVAKDYQKKCSGSNITISGGGSSTGLKNVSDGSVGIGNSDIYADATKYPGLVDNQVAVVVFSVVINSKVTGVTNLTSAQLQGIYSGKTKNWNQLGGPNLAIVPVSRPSGSGTRATFEQFVLGQPESITGNPTASTSGDVANTVNETDGAISYVQTSYAQQNNLTIVSIDGVSDADANVENNTYQFWNLEHMYTKGVPTGLALSFINYMKSAAIESFRTKDGFLDISKLGAGALAAKAKKA